MTIKGNPVCKLDDQKLCEVQEKYNALYNRSLHCIYIHDLNGNFIDANDAALSLLCYNREEISYLNFSSLLSQEQIPKAMKALGEIKRTGFQQEFLEFTLKRKDGKHVSVETDSSLICQSGTPYAILGVARDITIRKQAEKALKDSEEKYRLLVENANDAIFILQDGQVKFPNRKGKEIGQYLGIKLDEVPFVDYIHPDDRDMVIDRHVRRLQGEKLPNNYVIRLVGIDNQELWAELSVVVINWEGKPATLNFLRDITSQKKIESQLQQAQKMQAIGTLAGGVAHDFNNLLMCIQGNASMMLGDLDSSMPHYEKLENIMLSVKSAAELTKQLLGFARDGKYKVELTNLNDIIITSLEMFARTRKEIKTDCKLQNNIWMTEVDHSQIQQVLLNLFVNAWQAMTNGGNLYIETQNIKLEDEAMAFEKKPGRFVKISVTDNGIGMDEKVQQRIFEPFFTTKKFGQGTGMGLASAYSIVKNHGGIIDVSTQLNIGTTFNIYLPASENKMEKEIFEQQATKPLDEILYQGKAALVVDDEKQVLSTIEIMLKNRGFQLYSAFSGSSAIKLYKKNKKEIDIVVLDMIMPEMDGARTYLLLKEINPDIKVLFSSGYSMEAQIQELFNYGGVDFIQKPFSSNELLNKINELINFRN